MIIHMFACCLKRFVDVSIPLSSTLVIPENFIPDLALSHVFVFFQVIIHTLNQSIHRQQQHASSISSSSTTKGVNHSSSTNHTTFGSCGTTQYNRKLFRTTSSRKQHSIQCTTIYSTTTTVRWTYSTKRMW